jgi:CubicO group peptidase (beta-lactamase class C family)
MPVLAQNTVKPAAAAARGLTGIADFVDGVVAQQIASREVAGAVVTVVHKGRVMFTRGYGYSDFATRTPVDGQHSLFRPGSVSKLFTWVALMQQVERGRVDLDADVNRYIDFKIPAFEGKPIRVRDLLSHSPGMSDVSGFIVDTPDKLTPYADWIKAHVPKRLWAPGTEISYSNFGAALAGYIVERVSGEPYADYVEKHVFKPIGMTSTTFREPLPTALAPRLATGYRFADGRLQTKSAEYLSSIMPAGSAVTSAPDMARFMMAILGKGTLGGARILTPQSVAMLESNSLANVPGLPGMAHGFLVYRDAGPRLVGHAGNTIDFHSDLIIAPELGTGFFISFTGGGMGSSLARTELSEALTGRLFPETPAPRFTGAAGTPQLGAYRGNRRDYGKTPDPKRDIVVEAAGPRLLTISADGIKTAWEQIGPDEYEQVTGARVGGPFDRIKFYGTPQDRKLSYASHPYMTYHFVPAQ